MTSQLPISQIQTPSSIDEAKTYLLTAFATGTAVYPMGGGTSLDYGLPAKQPGIGLELHLLNRIIDYPARDMTVTVEAGIRFADLQASLAAEGQQLPFNVPDADKATVGGILATNFNGGRTFGYGSIRDYVIGIHGINGRGMPFKGGGQVVKNVAGYDFCKLLTGSMGTLAAITQVTFKLKPVAEVSAAVVAGFDNLDTIEEQLAYLVSGQVAPTAIDLLVGSARPAEAAGEYTLRVLFEGTETEVESQLASLRSRWESAAAVDIQRFTAAPLAQQQQQIDQFPREPSSLSLRISVMSSAVTKMVALCRQLSAEVAIVAYAGTGLLNVQFPDTVSVQEAVRTLQPAAAKQHGHVTLLSSATSSELTTQSVWGSPGAALKWMRAVKREFDPKNILNPGRYVYD